MNGTAVIRKLTTFASSSAAVLEKIGRPFWNILNFSLADDIIYPAKNLTVSIEKGSLSVAYGSRFLSRIKIREVREYSFEEGKYPQPEVLASSLALAINDFLATKADVSLSIPKEWFIIKTAEFPVTVKETLSNVISYELDRLTPFSPENAFYDFKVLGENAGKLTVLVIAAKADLVKPYIEALRDKGIVVSRVTVNLSGIETLCCYIDKKTNTIFVEIRENGYEVALFLNRSITNSFSGTFTAEDEKSKVETILSEIAQLTDTAKRFGKTPQVMVLFRDKNSQLKELLKLHINVPVRILDETDIRIRLSKPVKDIPYTAIGGVLEALWPKANGFNLLNRGYHEKPKFPKALTVILMLTILAAAILYIISPLKIEEKRLKEIDRQIIQRKDEVRKVEAIKKEVETLSKEISTIHNFRENRPLTLNILKEFTTTLPKSAWLSRVRISDAEINIEGYATSATGLLPKLEASNYFKKAEFASPTFRDARMNADRFNIKMEIEGIKTDEGLKNKVKEAEDEEE